MFDQIRFVKIEARARAVREERDAGMRAIREGYLEQAQKAENRKDADRFCEMAARVSGEIAWNRQAAAGLLAERFPAYFEGI